MPKTLAFYNDRGMIFASHRCKGVFQRIDIVSKIRVDQLNYSQCVLLLELLLYFEIDIDTRPETQALIELWGKLQQEGQKDSLRIQWN